MQRRSVPVRAGSRLAHYAEQFAKNAYAATTAHDRERVLEQLLAQRDVEEISKALEMFPDAGPSVLAPLADDAIVPRMDRSTPGRDLQAELFFASTCKHGKMAVELGKEPDLWCQAGGAWLGLAVKRLRSAEKFSDRVEDAAKQVQKHAPWAGLVCVDVSLGWNPEMRAIVTPRDPVAVAFDNRERLSRLLDEHNTFLHKMWRRYPKCLALLCIDQVAVFELGASWVTYQYSLFHRSAHNTVQRVRLLQAFQAGWQRGSENCFGFDHVPRTGEFSGPPTDQVMALRSARQGLSK